MHNINLTSYNFTHGLHKDAISGEWIPLNRHSLGRALTHEEMDYNLDLIGRVINGYRVMGTGLNGDLHATDDIDKVLKLYKVTAGNTALIANGAVVDEIIWIPAVGAGGGVIAGGTVVGNLVPDVNEAYDLGSPTKKFRDLYLSGNTMYIGTDAVSMLDGIMQINGEPVSGSAEEIAAEAIARAEAIGIETTARTVAEAAINSQLTTISDANGAVAQSVIDLDTSFGLELVNAITGETLLRTEAVSGITETLISMTTANGAVAQSVTDLDTAFGIQLNDAITGEQTSRTDALATVNETLTSLSDENSATASSVTALGTSFTTEINNKVGAETTARESAIAAEVIARAAAIQVVADTVSGDFDPTGLATSAELATETSTRVSAIAAEASARATALGLETTSRTAAITTINTELTALSNADASLVSSVDTLGATFTTNLDNAITGQNLLRTDAIAGVTDSITALTTADQAIVLSVTNLGTQFTTDIDAAITGEAAIRTTAITDINAEIVALSDADGANLTRVETLEAEYTITDGTIDGLAESSAIKVSVDSAIATETQARATALTGVASTLNGQVATAQAELQTNIDTVTGTVNAAYTLEVNAEGNVAGMKLGADANGSEIAFTADSFKVYSGDPLSANLAPFSIIDGQVAFNGAVSFGEGVVGPAGPTGPTGPTGTSGVAGIDGLQGTNGTNGIDGVPGTNTYFHIAYADDASGLNFNQNPLNRTYIGTYVDSTEGDALSDSILWQWKSYIGLDGSQGLAGTNGSDGLTSYLHIAYSTSADGSTGFDVVVSAGKTYIGQYTDFTPTDSEDPAYYSWSLMQGAAGTNGLDGSQGIAGPDGSSTYFHVAYANDLTGGGFSQIPGNKTHIGTYVDSTETDADSTSNLWQWKSYVGLDGSNGIPGSSGSSGQTSYLHIAYANSPEGEGFDVENSIDKQYIGQYTDFAEEDSEEFGLYTWSLIQGPAGANGANGLNGIQGTNGTNGVQGAAGSSGVSTYFHIAYADNVSGGGFSQSPAGKTYIGTYVDTNVTDEGSGGSSWGWQLVAGADGTNGSQGIAGTNGSDGSTSYLHIAYATNSTGSTGFDVSVSAGKTYIGQYTDFTQVDSSTSGDYTWSLIQGADGTSGSNGTNGSSGSNGSSGTTPDTSLYLTTSTTINGGQITTGIIKNGNFAGVQNWDSYSTLGMGINLDNGAINATKFFIDPAGNAKFKGDIDMTTGGASIGGSDITNFFEVDPSVGLRMKGTAYMGGSTVSSFASSLSTATSNISSLTTSFDGLVLSEPPGGGGGIINATLPHQHIKRNDILIQKGDLVKLDANNELIKVTSVKDTSAIGILWSKREYTSTITGVNGNELAKDTSKHYMDSLNNVIPESDRTIKSIWKVAAIGDTRNFDTDATLSLDGMKVCDQNGPVSKGDLVCSSSIPGYVMKQPPEHVIIGFTDGIPHYEEQQSTHSFTVGKCMEDCVFDANGKVEGIYGYLYCG